MKAHRGTVTVDDCPNGGALLSLRFPLANESN
jgi:signal transduction histidine kinase